MSSQGWGGVYLGGLGPPLTPLGCWCPFWGACCCKGRGFLNPPSLYEYDLRSVSSWARFPWVPRLLPSGGFLPIVSRLRRFGRCLLLPPARPEFCLCYGCVWRFRSIPGWQTAHSFRWGHGMSSVGPHMLEWRETCTILLVYLGGANLSVLMRACSPLCFLRMLALCSCKCRFPPFWGLCLLRTCIPVGIWHRSYASFPFSSCPRTCLRRMWGRWVPGLGLGR